MGKLIKKIPGLRLLISSLPVPALKTHVESLGSLAMSTSVLKALPCKFDIKRRPPIILYIAIEWAEFLFEPISTFVLLCEHEGTEGSDEIVWMRRLV